MKIPTLLYSLVFLCAGFCCPEDREFEGGIYNLEAPGLVKILNEGTNYAKGDTLWISVNIPVLLKKQNGEMMDISELAGNSDRAYLYLNLYWRNEFEYPSPMALSQNEIIAETGEVVDIINNNITATAFLSGESFTSNFGIKLKESGSYFLGPAVNPGKNPLRIYVDTKNGNSIYISTTFANVATNPEKYSFTVE